MDYDDEQRISCKNLIRPAINIVKLIEFVSFYDIFFC